MDKTETLNIEVNVVTTKTGIGVTYAAKKDLVCWASGCLQLREWAVFHSEEEAEGFFDFRFSVYIGICSEHLPLALQRHPTALNYIRPY